MSTQQETFDIVAKHLLTQNKRSFGPTARKPNGECVYRGPDGCKCAAGCLIPDDLYTPSFEGRNIHEDRITQILNLEGHEINLVSDLQVLHDTKDHWPAALASLAQHHNLDPAIITTVLTELGRANEIPTTL